MISIFWPKFQYTTFYIQNFPILAPAFDTININISYRIVIRTVTLRERWSRNQDLPWQYTDPLNGNESRWRGTAPLAIVG